MPENLTVEAAIERALAGLHVIASDDRKMNFEKVSGKDSNSIEIRPSGHGNTERIYATVVFVDSGPQFLFTHGGSHN